LINYLSNAFYASPRLKQRITPRPISKICSKRRALRKNTLLLISATFWITRRRKPPLTDFLGPENWLSGSVVAQPPSTGCEEQQSWGSSTYFIILEEAFCNFWDLYLRCCCTTAKYWLRGAAVLGQQHLFYYPGRGFL
jgi:hypothetical protein